jgi:hypothetical protein
MVGGEDVGRQIMRVRVDREAEEKELHQRQGDDESQG